MSKPIPHVRLWTILLLGIALVMPVVAMAAKTLVVTSEGLADPNADTYKRDKGLLIDALVADAKKQAIEKVVGAYVESSSLVENYALINDRVLTRTRGLIKRVIKTSKPWLGEDGFMHLLMEAEVYTDNVRGALNEISRVERVELIKERGNPRIAVSIMVRNAERGSDIAPERSPLAENILKEQIQGFGYRVVSEEVARQIADVKSTTSKLSGALDAAVSYELRRTSDFAIRGEAKLTHQSVKMKYSGRTITKYVLTSFSVSCVNSHNAEQIYFNNKVPRNKSWNSEDAAIEDIGKLIAKNFTKDFFEEQLDNPIQNYRIELVGLPSFDIGHMVRKELIGLRPVVRVDFRDFDANGVSLFEVEFAGQADNFTRLVNSAIIKPLNEKFGERAFSLRSAQGGVVQVSFVSDMGIDELIERFDRVPPSSLTNAAPERVRELVQSEEAMEKVEELSPALAERLKGNGDPTANKGSSLGAIRDF